MFLRGVLVVVSCSLAMTACSTGVQDAQFSELPTIEVGVEPSDASSTAGTPEAVATLTLRGEGAAGTQPSRSVEPSSTAAPAPTKSKKAPKESRPDVSQSETPRTGDQCDPNYAGACVPISPFDLDCPDIGEKVQVIGDDIHGFDRDRDGFGCETYG